MDFYNAIDNLLAHDCYRMLLSWIFKGSRSQYIVIWLVGSGLISICVYLNYFIDRRTIQLPMWSEVELHGSNREIKTKLLRDGKAILFPHFNLTKIFLVILVVSAPAHVKRRQAIRNTWGNSNASFTDQNGKLFQAFFLIGQSNLNASVTREHKLYKDVILGTVEDGYRRLVNKIFLGINWALKRIHFEYLIKCDDDVYVNVRRVLKWLQSNPLSKLDLLFFCRIS